MEDRDGAGDAPRGSHATGPELSIAGPQTLEVSSPPLDADGSSTNINQNGAHPSQPMFSLTHAGASNATTSLSLEIKPGKVELEPSASLRPLSTGRVPSQ